MEKQGSSCKSMPVYSSCLFLDIVKGFRSLVLFNVSFTDLSYVPFPLTLTFFFFSPSFFGYFVMVQLWLWSELETYHMQG